MSHHGTARTQNISANYISANDIELGPDALSYIQSALDPVNGAGGDIMSAGGGIKGNPFSVPHSIVFSFGQNKYVMDDPSFTFDVVNKTLIVPKVKASSMNDRPIDEYGNVFAYGSGVSGKSFTARSIVFAQGNNKNLQDDPAFSYDPFTQTITVPNINAVKINGSTPSFGDLCAAGGAIKGKNFTMGGVLFAEGFNKYVADDIKFTYDRYTHTLTLQNLVVTNVNGAPLGTGSGDVIAAGGGVKGAVFSANSVLFSEGNNKYIRDDSSFNYNPLTKTLSVINISATNINGIVPGDGNLKVAGGGIIDNTFSASGTVPFSYGVGKYLMDDPLFIYNTLTRTLKVSNIDVNNINGLPPGGGSGGDLFAAGNGIKGNAFTGRSVLFAHGNDKYIQDDADFYYDTTSKSLFVPNITATNVNGAGNVFTDSDFIANSVLFAVGSDKKIQTDLSFSYNPSSKTLSTTNLSTSNINGLVIGPGITGDLISGHNFAKNGVLFSSDVNSKTILDDPTFVYDPDSQTLYVNNLNVSHISGSGQNAGILQLSSTDQNIVMTPTIIQSGKNGSISLNSNLTNLNSIQTASLTCAGNNFPLNTGSPGQALVTSGGGITFWNHVGDTFAFGVDPSTFVPTQGHNFHDGAILFSYGNSTRIQDFPLLSYDVNSHTIKTVGISGHSSSLHICSTNSVSDFESSSIISSLNCTNKSEYSTIATSTSCSINPTVITTNQNFNFIGSSQNTSITGDFLSAISCISCTYSNDHTRTKSTNGFHGASSLSTINLVSSDFFTLGCTGLKLTNIWNTASYDRCGFIASGLYDTSNLAAGQEGTGPSTFCLVSASVNSGIGSTTSQQKTNIMVLGSKGVLGKNNYSVCGGYGFGAASTTNRTWELDSIGGNLYLTGSIFSAVQIPDKAEWFKNGIGKEIPVGTMVRLTKGRKVVPAKLSDPSILVIGIVTSTPAIASGVAWSHWKNKYIEDEWGRPVKVKQYDALWKPGPGQTETDRPYTMTNKLNPAYDPNRPYIPQSDRPNDYTCVAIVGQPRVRIDKTVQEFDFLCPSPSVPGMASKCMTETRFLCIEIVKPYGLREDGTYYGIAVCLLK